MNTPICDFVRQYAAGDTLRLHMPGHKGQSVLGMEQMDITEISGADSLYEADGIIRESEANASDLFECPTFYSTEGSSQCIRAMLYLVSLWAREKGMARCRIAAARNVHKTFLSAAALLDLDVDWLYPQEDGSYLSCRITGRMLKQYFEACDMLPAAVYVTSPDYLGNVLAVDELAAVCHDHGVLLVVDNAHGAYLKFLPGKLHPMELGADLCCDSAHKTLPVLTGGAYLHVSPQLPPMFLEQAKEALAMFGSTSPSYLILQSLDAANSVLSSEVYRAELAAVALRVANCVETLCGLGIPADGSIEPLKLTLRPKRYGYTGTELAVYLRANGIESEFADPDYLVLMFTPAITENDIRYLTTVLAALPRREAVTAVPPALCRPRKILSIRDAAMAPRERLDVGGCLGRVLAAPSVGCPPAVPVLVCGEQIDDQALENFAYYGITQVTVVKKDT